MRYYVTTGKSLSESSRCWKFLDSVSDHSVCRTMKSGEIETVEGWNYLQECRASVKMNLLDAIETADPEQISQKANELVNKAFDSATGLQENRLYHLLPAEIATIKRMSISAKDEIIFLMGDPKDTDSNAIEGFLCQALLQKLIADGNFPAVTISCRKLFWHPGGPHFEEVMYRAAESFAPRFDLVLTGGFKGVILSLAANISCMAVPNGQWADYRRAPDPWRPYAYYIEENSDILVRIKLA